MISKKAFIMGNTCTTDNVTLLEEPQYDVLIPERTIIIPNTYFKIKDKTNKISYKHTNIQSKMSNKDQIKIRT